MPKVFISHNHQDKPLARRISRFLRLYGVDAWLDERELRLGNRLDDSIRQAIKRCDTVLVVATVAAAKSPWVEREISFAVESTPAIAVCPVYFDDVIAHPSFAPHLGIDATDRYRLNDVLSRLAEAFVGSPLPEPDAKKLEGALNELSLQNAALALLTESCLRGGGLLYEQVSLVAEVPFFDLDGALDLISRLGGGNGAASVTASLFSKTGAGSAALARYLRAGHRVLNTAVGDELDPALLDTAIRLLRDSSPRDDQALASFLWKNKKSLSGDYRDTVLYLVTHPRRGPGGFGADAAAAAFDIYPDDEDLVTLWSRWVREGLFDRRSNSDCDDPSGFAYWSGRGLKSESEAWNKVYDQFVAHVRGLVRKKARDSVDIAIGHLMANVDRENPRRADVVATCDAATGAAESDDWEDRQEMSAYVSAFTAEARGKGQWGSAYQKASESWEALKAHKLALENLKKGR